jgi:hypothetical protein
LKKAALANMLNESNLQISPRKNSSLLQKNGGLAETILHFAVRFFGFLRFLSSQAIAFQQQAPIQTITKKSYLKTYRRFFGFCGLW